MAFTKATFDYLDSGGLINWITTAKTADFTAVSNEGYFVNTTSAAITVTLPSSPTAGDEIIIVDYAGTADTNNITITSSDNINGASNDVLINYERGGVSMVYVDATQGWIAYNATNETATALKSLPPLTVDYLVVAGGGAGGTDAGAGGGAGGLRTSYGSTSGGGASAESSLSLTVATDYTVSVGPGGSGVSGNDTVLGGSGTNSTFSTITSTGGGGGAGDAVNNGGTGGSGGGAGAAGGNGGAPTANQGFAGGNSAARTGGPSSGGGGGGAGEAGTNWNNNSIGGRGGAGISVGIISSANATSASVGHIVSSEVYFAGGGSAGVYQASLQTPGNGGGGSGASAQGATGGAGLPNTGGGGGGGSSYTGTGGSGGSGVVILRYPDTYTISETTSQTVLTFNTYTEGGDKVTVFTAGESGTIQFTTA